MRFNQPLEAGSPIASDPTETTPPNQAALSAASAREAAKVRSADLQPSTSQQPAVQDPEGPAFGPQSVWAQSGGLQPAAGFAEPPGPQVKLPQVQQPAVELDGPILQAPVKQLLSPSWNEIRQPERHEIVQPVELQWSGSNEDHWPELPEPAAAPVQAALYSDPARRQRIDREQSGGLWNA